MKSVRYALLKLMSLSLILEVGLGLCLVTPALARPSQGTRTEQSRVLSYTQWKLKRVQEAKDLYLQALRELKKANNAATPPARLGRLNRKVEQSRTNIDLAKDLSSHDYFVAYLTERFAGDTRALMSAVKTMTPEEIAEILIQYQGLILQSRGSKAAQLPSVYTGIKSPQLYDFDRSVGSAEPAD